MKSMKKEIIFILFGLLGIVGNTSLSAQRARIDLSGVWQTPLGDCQLPGTTDESRLGEGAKDTAITFQLTRLYPYSGKISYSKQINIPASLQGKQLYLMMERTKPSTLWIDGDRIGSQSHIYAPHEYKLPSLFSGVHDITIQIDNSITAVPQEIQSSHAWTDGTQTNWNGVLGDFFIEARAENFIRSVQVYPSIPNNNARVVVCVEALSPGKAKLIFGGDRKSVV